MTAELNGLKMLLEASRARGDVTIGEIRNSLSSSILDDRVKMAKAMKFALSTISGTGMRLIADFSVRPLEIPTLPEPVSESVAPSSVRVSEEKRVSPRKRRRRIPKDEMSSDQVLETAHTFSDFLQVCDNFDFRVDIRDLAFTKASSLATRPAHFVLLYFRAKSEKEEHDLLQKIRGMTATEGDWVEAALECDPSDVCSVILSKMGQTTWRQFARNMREEDKRSHLISLLEPSSLTPRHGETEEEQESVLN